MGRPKGSKNGAVKKVRVAKEKLNITVINRAFANLADLAADLSLVYREQAQAMQLERELMVAREAALLKQTEEFMKAHSKELMSSIDSQMKAESETTDEPKPANLAELFNVDPDPERK